MKHNPSRLPVCVVAGVGPGNGAAFVRRFAADGYAVAMIARSAKLMNELAASLASARAYVCDVADPAAVTVTFETIAADLGPADVLIYNAGKGVWGSVDDVSVADFEACWRVNTLGAYAAARAVIPAMKTKGAGSIVFVGATASRRGGAMTAAFAPSKAAQRSLAESLAKSHGPQGIHVSVIIVDGLVDEPVARARAPEKPDDFFIKPDDVADMAVMLTRQKRSAWSFELEARPFGEKW